MNIDAKILNFSKSTKGIYHINKINVKNMTILIKTLKTFDKVQHPFMIKKKKTHTKVGIEGTYINIIKGICDQPTPKITLNGEKLKDFLLKSGKRQR